MKKVNYIPLGTRCSSAFVIRDNIEKREFSLPFDWLDMPLTAISNFISVKYENIDNFTNNYFDELGSAHIHADGTWFPHDIVWHNNTWTLKPNTKEKFARRLKRLSELLITDGFFVFLTTIIKEDKYEFDDFEKLKIQLEEIVGKENCVFITINLGKDFINENHYNYLIEPADDDDGLKIWEKNIAEKLNIALEHFGRKRPYN